MQNHRPLPSTGAAFFLGALWGFCWVALWQGLSAASPDARLSPWWGVLPPSWWWAWLIPLVLLWLLARKVG